MTESRTEPIEITNESELQTLPAGLYVFPGRERRREFIASQNTYFEGEFRLYARILPSDAAPLPEHLALNFEVRPDGCQIFKQWVGLPNAVGHNVKVQ